MTSPSDPVYPRDLVGYGVRPPHARWPGGARIAVNFVLNYEEGAENCVLHGDPASETFLSEIVGAQAYPMRHLSIESLYEYGSRAGVWRLLRLFRERSMPLTVFGVAMALARNPAVVDAMSRAGLKPEHAEVTQRAAIDVPLAGEDAEKVWKLIEVLEELDDVQQVYSNAHFPDEVVQQHAG